MLWHDFWIFFIWFLLETGGLCWPLIARYYIFMIAMEPYQLIDLVAEILLLDLLIKRQSFWRLESFTIRFLKSSFSFLFLLIVQRRFAIYDKSIAIGLWFLFLIFTGAHPFWRKLYQKPRALLFR